MSGPEDGREPAAERTSRLAVPDCGPLAEAGTAHLAREARASLYAAGTGAGTGAETGAADDPAGPGPGPRAEGPVPAEELARLRRVYRKPAGHDALRDRLAAARALALCGDHGTGRAATALTLLGELAGGRVRRLALSTARVTPDSGAVDKGHGYLLEVPADALRAGPERHLDLLRALFTEREGYAVVLVADEETADRLLRDRRHAAAHQPPPAHDVLQAHLADLLAGEPEALAAARRTAARADLWHAVGLDEPRPGEAAWLAGRLAAHARGRLTDAELLDACRSLAPRQARAWLAGADCPAALPDALPALRATALRVALAVFNGAPHSVAAEAAELLTWELAVALDPQYAPGRALFGPPDAARLAAARATAGTGAADLGDAAVPVRVARYRGRLLAPAVLSELWDGHHNLRAPVARWLRELCDDPRPQVWVRAAAAAGALCARDLLYGLTELLLPLARAGSPVRRPAAATAVAEAARDPGVRPAVAALLRDWAAAGPADEPLRLTAALAHGYGLVADSVRAALDELGRADWPDGGAAASLSVARLLAGPEPRPVLARLGQWLGEEQPGLRELALLTVLRALTLRASRLWGGWETSLCEPYGRWPLAGALLAARPECAERLAGLVRAALTSPRSAAAAQEALVAWLRRATGDQAQLRTLGDFLPLLTGEAGGAAGGRAAARIREVLETL
ncbi:hypothetical protein RKE29_02540 [Streptomyces sp. B1866]|uniref:hypothetical protein n=1 Tax=Streptomyces sp. B1866 TaxID=3075431 RepID=UPI00288D2B91|nr:hypothetical protein [Streptomyces sp. B1866]MDT3395536.1 hypothetical protein [Streptomyces sp. B1866]